MNRRAYIKYTTGILGYAVSTTAVLQLLSSCRSQSQLDWKPIFFSTDQAKLITEIAETILPETSTPGAKSVGAPQFIDLMCAQLLTVEDKKKVTEGMLQFEKDCMEKNKQSFTALNTKDKETFLIDQDHLSPQFPISMWGIMLDPTPPPITFYRRIKSMILMAYFTSPKVSKELLVYAPVPGDYIGCVPLGNANSYSE